MSEQDLNLTPTPGPNGADPEPSKIFIDETEWLAKEKELAELRGYRKGMEDAELRLGQQHPELSAPQSPPPAPAPEFQLHSEEELQQAIEEGDLKSYHKMMRHNNEATRQKDLWELRTKEIEPLRMTGSQALSELSGKFASQTMSHLDIPEVKKTYEERLKQLRATGQVANSEVHKNVYEWAVGTHIDKVQEKIQQGLLRQAEQEVQTQTSAKGRTAGGGKTDVPNVTEFYPPEALTKLQQKHPGLSAEQAADREFAQRGYGNWAGYYQKFYANQGKEGE